MFILRKTGDGVQMERIGNPMRNKLKIRDPILKKIDALEKKTGGAGEFEKTRLIVEKIFDKDTSAHYKSNFESGMGIFGSRATIARREITAEMTEIVEDVKKFLHSEGYRCGYTILTPQEDKLSGDVPHATWKPFVPVGLHIGKFTLKEADKARRLTSYMYGCLAHLSYELNALFVGTAQGMAEYIGRFWHDARGLPSVLQTPNQTKFSLQIGKKDYEARKTENGLFELHYVGMGHMNTLEPLHKEGQEKGDTLRNPRIIHPLLTDDALDDIFMENKFEKALDICTIETKRAEPLYWELRK